MRIAYQGVPGAFGHEACLAFCPDFEPTAEPSFAAVVEAVVAGRAVQGLLPVHNVEAGEVPGNRDLIDTAPVRVIAEQGLTVRLHLLGLPDAALADVKVAVSHPIALRQCAASLARLGLATEDAGNTALAARDLRDPFRAALASEAAARLYGLSILLGDLQDRPDNVTIFAIFERS